MTPLIIDCDPGHDDAMAILFAARHFRLIGLTTVFGNASVAATTRNALGLCALARLPVPVAVGMAGPIRSASVSGAHIHGGSGLDGATLPEPVSAPIDQNAITFIIEQARAMPGELVLAALGPLTNVAMALRLEPRLAGWLKGITLMGGSTGTGNITSHAEFNAYCDPEAMAVVFDAGVPISMVGLNVTRQAGIDQGHIDRLRHAGGPVARTFADLLDFYLQRTRQVYQRNTASMHDPCALLGLVAPELIVNQDMHVHVELASAQLRGMTACDLRDFNQPMRAARGQKAPNAKVAISMDGAAAVDRVIEVLLGYDD